MSPKQHPYEDRLDKTQYQPEDTLSKNGDVEFYQVGSHI